MEPTGAISELRRLLGKPADVANHNPYWTVHAVRSIAVEVAIIVGLACVIGACLALVVWLWMVVL